MFEHVTQLGSVQISSGTTIREVHPSELTSDLAETYVSAFSGGAWNEDNDPTEVIAKLRTARAETGSRILLCFFGDRPIGGAQFMRLHRLSKIADQLPSDLHASIYLNDIWLAPSHQNLGLGSKLLNCVEQAVASLGASQLVLWTHADHPPLLKFYMLRGYEPVLDVNPSDGSATRRVFAKPILVIDRNAA